MALPVMAILEQTMEQALSTETLPWLRTAFRVMGGMAALGGLSVTLNAFVGRDEGFDKVVKLGMGLVSSALGIVAISHVDMVVGLFGFPNPMEAVQAAAPDAAPQPNYAEKESGAGKGLIDPLDKDILRHPEKHLDYLVQNERLIKVADRIEISDKLVYSTDPGTVRLACRYITNLDRQVNKDVSERRQLVKDRDEAIKRLDEVRARVTVGDPGPSL